MNRLHLIILLYFFSIIVFGQKKTKITVNYIEPLKGLKGELVSGTAIRDITPSTGLPSAGRSLSGKAKMKGFRTRLKARVCYIRDKEGKSVALVQLDLAFPSLNMHHQIAEEIAKKTDIPISNLVLNCTHTHSGPGSFYSSDFYNTFASKIPGFNNDLYKFIVDQIVSAILEAYNNAKPAKIATGSTELYNATRNRSINSFIRNKGNESLDPKKDSSLIFKAINPNLYMIRIDTKDNLGNYNPAFVYSVFSSHGTGLGDDVDVYNGDTFAYAQRDLPILIKKNYPNSINPIHAFTNGTEGDIAPNLPFYKKNRKETTRISVDWKEVKKLGDMATNSTWKLFKSLDNKLKSEIKISSGAKELNISENNCIDNICICKKAYTGSAIFGGAYENRTPFIKNMYPAESMMTRAWIYGKNSCHGNRHIPGGTLQRLIVPSKTFPKNVMFQLIQIDDMVLVPLPWEITITTGRRIENEIKNAYQNNQINTPKHIVIASLSNDYMGYAATPEEYSNQAYEGGSTLYGKNTAPYIASQLNHLADEMLKNNGLFSDFPKEFHYLLKTKNISPKESIHKIVDRTIVQVPTYVPSKNRPFEDSNINEEDYWEIQWKDMLPGNMNLHESVIEIEQSNNGIDWNGFNQPINDEGYDIEVRIEKEEKTFSIYKAKWYNPYSEKGKFYRFKILPRDEEQQILYSDSFQSN